MENEVKQSIIEFEQKIVSNDPEIRSELKKLLGLLDYLPEKPHRTFSVEISNIIFEHALKAYTQFDFIKLVDMQDCARMMFFHLSYIEETALTFLQIMRGMLELKIQMGENDNLEIYQEDLEEVMVLSLTNKEIGLECMLCYANLQANCSMAAKNRDALPVSISFVKKNIDNMEAISSKFPMDKDINLIYCRSLAATTSELRFHSNSEVYEKCVGLLQNLVQTRKFDVPNPVVDFLKMIS